MTRIATVLFAATLAVASPAFANGLSFTYMPTLTYPADTAVQVTKSKTTVLPTCETAKACTKAVKDLPATALSSRGE